MLDKVAKLHGLWIKCCINFGCNYQDAQDIVQEMYLKISKIENKDKFKYGEDGINKYYIYMTLKNLFIDIKRKKLLTDSLLLNDELDLPEDVNYDYARDTALEDIINDIRKDLSKKDQFVQKLFELYYRVPINSNVSYFSKEKLSQQKIVDAAKVTKYSVTKKLKRLKEELRGKYRENIEDFLTEIMINCKEVRDCWINGIFISPTAINSMQDVRIDVYNIENGKLITRRKGTTFFKQKTKKEKEKVYETILEAYKYYYNKL